MNSPKYMVNKDPHLSQPADRISDILKGDIPLLDGWDKLDTVRLADHDIVTASRARLTDAMRHDCLTSRALKRHGPPRLVFDVNGHGVSLAATDPQYRRLVASGDIIHADGGFLVTFSRLFLSKPITERSATTDLFHDFAAECVKHDLSIFLLGGTEEVNSQCADIMISRYPGLRIAGRSNGYYSKDSEVDIVDMINNAAPDILWIGLGKPYEQEFAVRWRGSLNVCWAVTCGGCYNYVTGHYRRAPAWMQKCNMEWLYRACSDPRKLLWRYATTSPRALWIVLKSCFV